jgi:hypothetical protein
MQAESTLFKKIKLFFVSMPLFYFFNCLRVPLHLT